jgi:hypothetical protein
LADQSEFIPQYHNQNSILTLQFNIIHILGNNCLLSAQFSIQNHSILSFKIQMVSFSSKREPFIPFRIVVLEFIGFGIFIILTIIDYYFTIMMSLNWFIVHHFPIFPIITMILTFISFLMFFWCFILLIFSDPGTVAKDLERRGFLKQIRAKKIPHNLQHLPICKKCKLPYPPLSHHCLRCGNCFLHHECHSNLWGRCIADKTFKAYILMFFWSGISGLFLFCLNTVLVFYDRTFVTFLFLIYSGWFTILLFAKGAVTLMENRNDRTFYDRKLRKRGRKIGTFEIFQTFGEKWWQKIIPRQINCTSFAWPRINWDCCKPYQDN